MSPSCQTAGGLWLAASFCCGVALFTVRLRSVCSETISAQPDLNHSCYHDNRLSTSSSDSSPVVFSHSSKLSSRSEEVFRYFTAVQILSRSIWSVYPRVAAGGGAASSLWWFWWNSLLLILDYSLNRTKWLWCERRNSRTLGDKLDPQDWWWFLLSHGGKWYFLSFNKTNCQLITESDSWSYCSYHSIDLFISGWIRSILYNKDVYNSLDRSVCLLYL